MAELEDWELFIAGVEETAIKEEEGPKKNLLCSECNVPYEDNDGDLICPICSAQAPYLAHIEEAEMIYDEAGQAIMGQRVSTKVRKKAFECDYGWAWSTDETVFHILCLQIDALENLGLVSAFFRDGIANMWLKFWDENIAPYLKDEYREEDLIPVETAKSLKYRDIEVLIKMKDKVMIPKRVERSPVARGTRYYRKDNIRFHKMPQESCTQTSESNNNERDQVVIDEADPEVPRNPLTTEDNIEGYHAANNELADKTVGQTRTLGRDNISILTLNRTLAFIEATARCMEQAEPIFASDLIRLCCQRLIPFFGAQNTLPEEVKLQNKDKLMFQKTRPPTPSQLSRTASLLIRRIYDDRQPFKFPVPSLDRILERFISDMNLPYHLLKKITKKIDFTMFPQTRPKKYIKNHRNGCTLPQYDRWAFAILFCQLKRRFNLSDDSVIKLGHQAMEQTQSHDTRRYFNLLDWSRQISIRLKLVMNYDPYMLYHPMTVTNDLEPSSQMYTYLETIINDRPAAQVRTRRSLYRFDLTYRNELTDFLKEHIPKPPSVRDLIEEDVNLERPKDLRHPLSDALNRTKKYWQPKLSEEPEVLGLVMRDFAHDKIIKTKRINKWFLFSPETKGRSHNMRIREEWPYCVKLLLSVGGYLCFCEPRELLPEIRAVEAFLYPESKSKKRMDTKRKKRLRLADERDRCYEDPESEQEAEVEADDQEIVVD